MAALEADPLKKSMADFLEAMKAEFLAMNRRLDVLEGRLRESRMSASMKNEIDVVIAGASGAGRHWRPRCFSNG